MNKKHLLHIFPSLQELADSVAGRIVSLQAGIAADRRRFRIALSGGTITNTVLPALADASRSHAVEWRDWDVFWVDERCVPANHPDSNAGAARRNLFAHVPMPPDRLFTVDGTLPANDAAREYESVIRQVFRLRTGCLPQFDLVLLGVGPDGHTASLFPEHPATLEMQHLVTAVHGAPKPPPNRVTLTLPVLNHARLIFVVATGPEKADIVSRALGKDPEDAALPIRRIRPEHGCMEWFLDRKAARGLSADQLSADQRNPAGRITDGGNDGQPDD